VNTSVSLRRPSMRAS